MQMRSAGLVGALAVLAELLGGLSLVPLGASRVRVGTVPPPPTRRYCCLSRMETTLIV